MSAEFPAGTIVFDAAGERIGVVRATAVDGRSLLVERGWLFLRREISVPVSAIRRRTPQGIYLRIYKAYLTHPYWNPQADTHVPASGGMPAPAEVEGDEVRVPLWEERLVVEKQQREIGRVEVRKYVVEEPQTVTMPVVREEVVVERVTIEGGREAGPEAFLEEDLVLLVRGEELVTHKTTHLAEEVRLRKERVRQDRAVTETLRKERLSIEGATRPDHPREHEGGTHPQA